MKFNNDLLQKKLAKIRSTATENDQAKKAPAAKRRKTKKEDWHDNWDWL